MVASAGAEPRQEPKDVFAEIFVLLLEQRSTLFGVGDAHGEAIGLGDDDLRTIAILAHVLVGRGRRDPAERLIAARSDLDEVFAGLGDAPAKEAAKRLCERAGDSDEYLKLHRVRVKLARAPGRDALLTNARAIVAEHGGPKLREAVREAPRRVPPVVRFPTLARLEAAWLNPPGEPLRYAKVARPSITREPHVAFPDRDYFGLALSGGGIRSATFNLGLLEALAEIGVLDHVDYVSTVSGGGYIGGFWTAWRHRTRKPFPTRPVDLSSDSRENPAVRHLREFSRFLVPRVGFGQMETWGAVVAVLGGTVASLLFTAAAVALGLWIALFAVCVLAALGPGWGAAVFGAVTALAHAIGEEALRVRGTLGDAPHARPAGLAMAAFGGLLALAGWLSLWTCPEFGMPRSCPDVLRALHGMARGHAERCAIAPAAVWAATALALLVLRGFGSRLARSAPPRPRAATERPTVRQRVRWWFAPVRSGAKAFAAALDRTAGRALSLAVGSAIFAGIVWSAGAIDAAAPWMREFAGAGGVAGAGLFAGLRQWLKAPAQPTHGSTLFARAAVAAKPAVPAIAAYVAAAAIFVAVAVVVRLTGFGLPAGGDEPLGAAAAGMAAAAAVVLAALVLFDPARVGLHEFYRGRIARGFLGASGADAGSSSEPRRPAATAEQPDDDLRLDALGRLERRQIEGSDGGPVSNPIHLVCCTANNLSGDVLGSLYRGGRSAAVSQFGLSVGDTSAAGHPDLRLSSVLTASAAAFNSQMGAVSMKVGPAVAFVMCALNLRLGLWLPHPLNPRPLQSWLPGWYFVLEALGRSRSDQVAMPKFRQAGWISRGWRQASKLHLSDGGHFENLGLYELVRRHCRYVFVSDAGADRDLHFDDLGNAVRRVREDFGVEVELDLGPLRRGDGGVSSQHAVVGTIHYDGLDGTDKGLVIYFKPTLTGDEPADVLEYSAADPAFPHDSTGDQFYDEAQWESYRRLGQHCAAAVLGLRAPAASGPHARRADLVDRIFYLAAQRWHRAQRNQEAIFLELTERSSAVEAGIPEVLRSELFPELAVALDASEPGAPGRDGRRGAELSKIQFLLRILQVMEDVWLAADLETYWSHPLNEGWMNYFRRWAETPAFRRWWPVLGSIYGARFREFVRQRFDLAIAEAPGDRAYTTLAAEPWASVLGAAGPAVRRRLGPDPGGMSFLVFRLHLENGLLANLRPLVVGILRYAASDGGREIVWHESDLVVPAPLQGGGFTGRFLDAIADHFAGARALRVFLAERPAPGEAPGPPPVAGPSAGTDDRPAPGEGAGAASEAAGGQARGALAAARGALLRSAADRAALVQTIALYKSRGFDYDVDALGSHDGGHDDVHRAATRLVKKAPRPPEPPARSTTRQGGGTGAGAEVGDRV